MAAAPTILDAPQLAVSTDLNDVTWLRTYELRGRLTISLFRPDRRDENVSRVPLSEWIHTEIEAQLLRVGASPGTPTTETDAHSLLSDQVYRARLLGYAGIAVALSCLRDFCVDHTLDSRDSWALLDFCKAAQALHVDLRLADTDKQLCAIPRPVSLGELIPNIFITDAIAAAEGLPVIADSGATATELSATPTPPPESATSRVAPDRVAPDSVVPNSVVSSSVESDSIAPIGILRDGAAAAREREALPVSSPRSMRAAMQDLLKDELGTLDDLETPVPQASVQTPARQPLPRKPEARVAPPKPTVPPTVGAITPTPQPTPVFEASTIARADKLIRALESTDGTRGWEEIEQRFTESYLPLQQLAPTLANPTAAEQALSHWASAFADSYRSAFEALRNNRGKRPRLVLDVPTHAFQLGRKLEIEQCKMVLVDAMRADLAPIVLDKLKLQMTHTAECVAEGLLWSALPSTTSAQMELIARGTDSLRHFTGELSEEQLLSRGNDLRRLRPVRVGSHRMYKLDIVQYLTRDASSHDRPKLEQYAAEIATSVGRFLRQQGPNTLVYVFGDHGFGGACDASPENVLVPYFAWRLLA